MKLFCSDTNSGMIRKILGWFGMNFNPKLSPGKSNKFNLMQLQASLINF